MNKQAVPLNSLTSVTDGGHIIYLFEDFDRYVDNAVSYILTGIDQGHHILLIEEADTYLDIYNKLNDVISGDQLQYLHYANNVEYYGSRGDFNFQHILTHFHHVMGMVQENNMSIRTWANVMTWGEHSEDKIQGNLVNYERQTCGVVREFGMVSVCAYNASAISSSLQLKMMREHEYMMTDVEFVKSPLYSHLPSDEVVFPSLSVQRRLLNEQKHLLIEKEAFSIREAVTDTLDILKVGILNKKLQVHVSIDPDIPEILIGDDGRFRQVILNLLGNAVKFTDEGDIFLEARLLPSDAGKVRLQFTVRDTGIGIPQDKRSHLFIPFHRVDNSITRRTEGTGLGLAICHRIVQLMNGEIAIEAEDPTVRGTTFTFTAEFDTYTA